MAMAIVGDSQAALAELSGRGHENRRRAGVPDSAAAAPTIGGKRSVYPASSYEDGSSIRQKFSVATKPSAEEVRVVGAGYSASDARYA
jgi:hypothetical protein